MSVKRRLIKAAQKFESYQQYINKLQTDRMNQQDQSLVQFDLTSSVEQELIAKKEAARKARNKRKAKKSK